MGRKEIIKKWHNYFSANLERGNSWNKIRLDLILKHRYKASLIEKLIYNYRIERAIKQKKKQRLAVGIAASLLIIMFVLPFFIKPSILGMVIGGGTNTDYLGLGNGVNIVFVDINNPNCNDGYTRTQALNGQTPWCHLVAPLTNHKMLSGDTLYTGVGEYNEEGDIIGWTITSNTTISAYPGDQVNITRYLSAYTTANNLWTNLGDGEYYTEITRASTDTPYPVVYLKNLSKFFGWKTYSLFQSSPYPYNTWYDPSLGRLHIKFNDITLNPNNMPLYISTKLPTIKIRSNQVSNGAYIIIQNVTFKYVKEAVDIIDQSNVLIQNINSYGGYYNIFVDGKGANSNVILRNSMLNGLQNPIWYGDDMKNEALEETTGFWVQNFIGRIYIHNNNFTYWHGSITLETQTSLECNNSEIAYNTFTHGRGSQMEIENYCYNSKWHHNIVTDNDYAGVSFAPAYAADKGFCNFSYNIIIAKGIENSNPQGGDNNFAIKAQSRNNANVSNWIIDHNTFYGYGRALNTMEITSGNLPGAWTKSHWTNNIFYAEKEYTIFRTGLSTDEVFYDYNLYYLKPGGWNLLQRWNNNNAVGYHTLADAKASSDWDGKWDIHSKQADPLFTDLSNNNLKPKTGSPACTMSFTGSYVGALPCEGESPPPAPFCGDGSCNGVENCSACEADCGICPEEQQPLPVCGDGSCNGLENCSTCIVDCGSCPVVIFCGDGTCNNNENCTTCSSDCGSCPVPEPFCGDDTCDVSENCSTCSSDCGSCPVVPVCGDDSCNGAENCSTCSLDCGNCPIIPICGDGSCNGLENCSTCSSDCGDCPIIYYCGDNACNNNENCSTCASDCGSCPIIPFCGDSSCNGLENCSICELDCGTCPLPEPFCGDGSCSVAENCSTCSLDCGNCIIIPLCGDGLCNGFENCSTCSADCGVCPEQQQPTSTHHSSGGGGGGGSSRLIQTNTSKNTSSSNLIGKAATWVKETIQGAEQKVKQELGEASNETESIVKEPGQESPGEVEIGAGRKENPALFTSIIILVIILLIGLVTSLSSHYPRIKTTLLSMRKSQEEAEIDVKKEARPEENMQKPKDLSISGLQNYNIEELAQLHKYAGEAASRGYSRERVKSELLGVGWEQHLVGILLSMHDSEFIPEEVPEPPLSQSAESAQTRPQNPDTVNPDTFNYVNKWVEFEDIR